MAQQQKKEVGDAYNAVVLVMEKIILDNYPVPFGRHHRNLKEDYEYFQVNAGIPIPAEVRDEKHLRAIDTNFEARSFGAVTYNRIKREFDLSIEQSVFPWYQVEEDMVANYRSALNPHDNNLIAWDIVVSKVLKNVCSSTYRIKVEHLCAKARLLFLEVLEVAFDRLPVLYPEHKVSQGLKEGIDLHIRHIISRHEAEARESLDLTLQSIIKNVSRSDVNFKALDQKVNEYDPEIAPESLMWVRAACALIYSAISRQLYQCFDFHF
eukprot:Phypoly_transcript_15007.p1 GENE.Phypoly_transcript_15007~~Phypoly_transcript_15007.p1  ORF type:complete len:266 (+),score=44.66 Phypoly_transcript_15007:101-898(+)